MDKERVTITLSPLILKAVDALVDGKSVRNRSHAIETLISRSLGTSIKNALVLAGGGGATKAMIAINGKPVIGRTTDWLVHNGIQSITFGIDKNGKKIREYFGDGNGFEASYVEEEKPLGTGGSIAQLDGRFNSTFVVCYGDILTDFDLRSMFSFHKRNKATVTVALKSVKDTKSVGIAHLDGARITGFTEKPTDALTSLANAGVYIMAPEVFPYLSPKCSFERDVLPKLIKDANLFDWGL